MSAKLCEPTLLLWEKDLQKIETYPDTSEDERHSKPDSSGDSHLSFCLQVVTEGDTKEDDRQGHKHDSEKWRALNGHLRFNPRICFW